MKNHNKLIDELTIYNAKNHTTIFCNREDKYIIPLYQRAYSWTDAEIEQLIDDILECNEKYYYIGSLIVYKRNDGFEVIDGQQRLTTLLLLLNELGLPVKNTLSFACREKANRTLENYINGKTISEEDLEQNLAKGKQIIAEKLTKDQINKETLAQKLTHLKLYRIQVPPGTDLNRYFEIMNTRGEQLEQHDILKAMLMSEIKNNNVKDLFAKIWEACSDMTGYVQMHFNVATRQLLFGKRWDQLQKIHYDEYIAHTIDDSTQKLSIDEILAPGFKVQYNDGDTNKNERVRFESIINFPHFLLHVLRVYIHTNNIRFSTEETWRLLDDKKLIHEFEQVLQYGSINQQPISKNKEYFSISFIECLLKCRFLFDKYIIKREYVNESADGEWSLKQPEVSGRGSKKKAYFRKTEFTSDEKQIEITVSRNEEITMLQSALRVSYTSPKVMHWITKLLEWLYEESDTKKWHSYAPMIENIIANAVKENFFTTGNRHMGVNTPHIVFNYLDFLLWQNDKERYLNFVFEFRNSVEHWYPQHPSEGTFDTWEQNEVNDFGNLCIIQRSINSRFSNMAPAAKKTTFKEMISKGSLKLQLMAEQTGNENNANIRWEQKYRDFGSDMIKLLGDACRIEQSELSRFLEDTGRIS